MTTTVPAGRSCRHYIVLEGLDEAFDKSVQYHYDYGVLSTCRLVG